MLEKVFLVLTAVVYVHSLSILNPGCGGYPAPPPTIVSSCGCDIPSPCACGGQLLAPPPLDLLTALSSLSPPCTSNIPLVNLPCGSNLPSPSVLPNIFSPQLISKAGQILLPQALASAPRAVIPELLVNAPAPLTLAAPSPCGCGASLSMPSPCGCASLPPVPSCGCSSCGCSSCGCTPALPVGCTNPFLPAASPVSAMAPQIVSPLLPPVCPCENRALYLRKIPIPPPCI